MAHIRKHPVDPKKWQVRYIDPTGRERSRTFPRKVDAEQHLIRVEGQKQRGEWIDPALAKTPFSEWLKQVTNARVHLRPSTQARDKSLIKTSILPHLGGYRLGSITPIIIQTWVAGLIAEGKSPATIRKAYQIASNALDAAVLAEMIHRSPCRGIKLPRIEQRKMRYLIPSQIADLADEMPSTYRALVLTAAYTGLRFGELAGLRLPRLDLMRRSLNVAEQLTEVNGQLVTAEPKTAASKRTVALPRFLVTELEGHLAARAASDGNFVFTTHTGSPLRRTAFRTRVWLPAVDATVGRPMRFHDLRHSHAAILISQGEHPKVIASRLGHTSIRTTLDVYGHLFDGLDDAAADRLDKLVFDSVTDKSRTNRTVTELRAEG